MDFNMGDLNFEEMGANFLNVILSAGFPVILGVVIALIILAFYSFRLWTIEVKIIVAIALGTLGYTLSATYVPLETIQEGLNIPVIVGLVCAIVGAIIAKFLFKISIFASGAFLGFSLGTIVFYPILLDVLADIPFIYEPYTFYIIGGVFALLLGILFVTLFKHVYIVITSFGCMLGAGYLVGTLITPAPTGVSAGVIFGIVMGIISMVKQYKMAKEMED